MNGGRLYFVLVCILVANTNAMTLYDYFNPYGVIREGLVENEDGFTLNTIDVPIVSGSLHYFRIHPDYWRITLRKMKSAGLNTVTTYMPWNLHNPRKNEFDFGDLNEDMSDFLNVKRFVELAMEEELFVILRPGPFIGGDWEFGGMPSWLLRDASMRVRSVYSGYTNEVASYYRKIYANLAKLFFTNGGSIIAMQIENDFGYFGYNDFPRETPYLEWLRQEMDVIGFNSLFYFTSDSIIERGDWGSCPGVLQAANIRSDVGENIKELDKIQPDRSHMVVDLSTGNFDHWITGNHEKMTAAELDAYIANLKLVFDDGAAVNMYMFAGGTNFGFMAGATLQENMTNLVGNEEPKIYYKPITTSYDYDAPIGEDGGYTEKYTRTVTLLQESYNLWNEIDTPDKPTERIKGVKMTLSVAGQMDFNTLQGKLKKLTLKNGTTNMEALSININSNGEYSGQSYGYILYETEANLNMFKNEIQIKGHVRDMAQLFVDNQEITTMLQSESMLDSFGFWQGRDKTITFNNPKLIATGKSTIQILVENLGRVSVGKPHYFDQRKGLHEGPVLINGVEQLEWKAVPLEFKKDFVCGLTEWDKYTGYTGMPAAYLFEYILEGNPKDIYIDTSGWQKGVIFVNGFNLGRYWTAKTPVFTMYLPAPLLRAQQINEIIVFEQYTPSNKLELVTEAKYQYSLLPVNTNKNTT